MFGSKAEKSANPEKPKRFRLTSSQVINNVRYDVLMDRMTGVCYTATHSYYGGTRIVPILDKDGKPYVDPAYR
ncbi:MAG: xylan 1,4-beta-xylosidase [Ruminococcus sp.]|nr:xylan 1,4-beta-xylosidase [Ruminococcus sp.]